MSAHSSDYTDADEGIGKFAPKEYDCTHTSDWHKEMKPCMVCGAEYSDEEAERIGNEATHPIGFSAAQMEIIRQHEAEQGDDL